MRIGEERVGGGELVSRWACGGMMFVARGARRLRVAAGSGIWELVVAFGPHTNKWLRSNHSGRAASRGPALRALHVLLRCALSGAPAGLKGLRSPAPRTAPAHTNPQLATNLSSAHPRFTEANLG